MCENTKPIRIAYIIDSLGKGGAQTALIHLVIYLSKRNYKQRIYSSNNVVHPDNKKLLLECGVEVKVIGKIQLVTMVGLIRILYNFISWKPTIVLTMLFYSDVIGRIAAKITARPIIISSIRSLMTLRKGDKNRLELYVDRLTVPWADKIIFNNKAAISLALQSEGIQEKQVVYIPNGVDTAFFSTMKIDRLKKREELNISNDILIIGSVGRLGHEKGFPYLLQSLKIIHKQFPHCVLLIIGAGVLLEFLKSKAEELDISEKVIFLGQRIDVPELLSGMDIYIHPSLSEGMPNAVMEAMAIGKPTIATSVGDTVELIEEGKTGWLVEPENSEALAEKICYVLNNPKIAEKVGLAAAERMTQKFSIEKMAQSYDNLFHQLIKEKL
ncbi:glycosyl transferase, group 1 family protein [Beggiatoa sp. PS]|nr:glycosyl transferase, group 1 family protein [Beggiatoa sp. PS]